MGKGLFVTLEGCEGVGKSTQLDMLRQFFDQRKIPALFTREPGGTPLAEQIRQLILSPDSTMDGLTELFLYAAARRSHVQQVIAPALSRGMVVVCDRFIDSTTAYQGYGRGLDLDLICSLNRAATEGISIDLTIFLDLPPQKGFERKGGADKGDRMDSESMDFHARVYQGFCELCKNPRIARIDASGEKDETFKAIIRAINERYRHKRF